MLGFGIPHLLSKFEVPGLICYGNIRDFVFENWDTPKWGNPLFLGRTDFTIGVARPMFPIQCTTLLSYDCSKWVIFCEKLHFTMENFKFRVAGAVGVGVKNFWTKELKVTPLRQIWSNKSFSVCASSVVFTLYGGEKKSTRKRPLDGFASLITTIRDTDFSYAKLSPPLYSEMID